MSKRDELLAEYDDARTELDRAHLERWLLRRRARLADVPVAPEDLEAARLQIREAERAVTRAENACHASRVTPSRLDCLKYLERHKERLRAERMAA